MKLKPGDFIIVGLILTLTAIIWFPFRSGGSAREAGLINAGQYTALSLEGLTDEVYRTVRGAGGIELTLELRHGQARIAEANCPDQVCVRTGWLERPGDCAVCLPGQVILQIEGDSQIDAVTG